MTIVKPLSKEMLALPSVARAIASAVEHRRIERRLRRETTEALRVLVRKGAPYASHALALAMSDATLADITGKKEPQG